MIATLVLFQYILRYEYSLDTVVEYDIKQSWETTDFAEMTVRSEHWKYSVTKMLAGGSAEMSVEKSLTGLEIDDEPIKIGKSKPTVVIQKHSTRGDIKKPVSPFQVPLMNLRLSRIKDLFYPVGEVVAGSNWTRQQSPEQSGGLPFAEWTWTLEKIEEDKAFGHLTFKESKIRNPIQAEGDFVISLKDGWPLELKFKASNTYQPGDEERLPTLFEFSMKRR